MKYFLSLVYLLYALSAAGQVFVTQSGAGLMNGTNWANAYSANHFPSVLSKASTGTAFWVKAGTYKPHATVRDSSFNIPKGVSVFGGFNGSETMLSQRNFNANFTILSGDIGISNVTSDNSYHVVTIVNADTSTTIDGCRITAGNADGFSQLGIGGGILVSGSNTSNIYKESSPRIRNCVFSENIASGGGGLCLNTGSSYITFKPLIENCLFENNVTIGSGFYNEGGGALLSLCSTSFFSSHEPVVKDCVFKNNQSSTNGGGLFIEALDGGAKDKVINCTFEANSANSGGGMYIQSSSGNFIIDSCTFLNNTATVTGGGVETNVGGVSQILLKRSNFLKNYAALYGSAIHHYPRQAGRSYFNIYNCTFRENDGGIYDKYAVHIESSGSVDTTTVYNCLFYNNVGEIFAGSADGSKTAVNFINNTVYEYLFIGGILFTTSKYNIGNSTVSFNIHNSVIWFDDDEMFMQQDSSTLVTVSHSIVKNGIPGTSNISLYPEFEDSTGGKDLRLRTYSPGLNTGDNIVIASLPQIDLDGLPRVFSDTVDMGAYETQKNKTVNILSVDTKKALMFPNPAKDFVLLENLEYATNIRIYNFIGQLVVNELANSPNHMIHLNKLLDGVYFVELNSPNKKEVRKLMVQH